MAARISIVLVVSFAAGTGCVVAQTESTEVRCLGPCYVTERSVDEVFWIGGVVRDGGPIERPVANATIWARSGGMRFGPVTSDIDGRFHLGIPLGKTPRQNSYGLEHHAVGHEHRPVELVVEALGFELRRLTTEVPVSVRSSALEVVLRPDSQPIAAGED